VPGCHYPISNVLKSRACSAQFHRGVHDRLNRKKFTPISDSVTKLTPKPAAIKLLMMPTHIMTSNFRPVFGRDELRHQKILKFAARIKGPRLRRHHLRSRMSTAMKATTARMLPSSEYARDGSSTTAGFGGSLSSGAGGVWYP